MGQAAQKADPPHLIRPRLGEMRAAIRDLSTGPALEDTRGPGPRRSFRAPRRGRRAASSLTGVGLVAPRLTRSLGVDRRWGRAERRSVGSELSLDGSPRGRGARRAMAAHDYDPAAVLLAPMLRSDPLKKLFCIEGSKLEGLDDGVERVIHAFVWVEQLGRRTGIPHESVE
jgi:hypothetical protein